MPIKHEWNGTILTITSDSGTSSADLQGAKGATGARGARGLTGRTGGGALIEDGVIRDDTTWSSAGIMDRFAEAFSTSGNPVVCNNALANVPFNIITDIDVRQEGSGNPYPAGGGKNLFDKNNYTPLKMYINVGTHKYMSYTDERMIVIPIKPNTTYTVKKSTSTIMRLATSVNYPANNVSSTSEVFYKKSPDDTSGNTPGNGPLTITSGANDAYLAVQLFADGDTSGSYGNIPANIDDLQVEEGSTATAYEPYSNIRPIVGYDAINITRSGKNLYNPNILTYGEPFFNSDGTTQTSTSVGVCYIPVKAGETYTITAYSQHYVRVAQIDSNKAFISGVRFALQGAENGASRTFTTTKNTAYLQIAQDKSLVKAQLEIGSTATAYEPYKGETYTLSLGNTYAQGVLDWNTGELVVDKKYMVLAGNEAKGNSLSGSTQCIWLNHTLTTDMAIGDYLDGYCSHFYNERKNKNVNTIRFGASADKTIYLYLSPDKFADATAFNTYAKAQYDAGTPIQIVYELAEPKIIKLEPQIIKALSGTNTLITNADNIILVGRYDTMKQLDNLQQAVLRLNARVIELEAKVGE